MDSEKIEILNIPNFYCTFYLKVLSRLGSVNFLPNTAFRRFDFFPVIIFKIRNKLVVIDNNDPIGIDQELYKSSNFYFATNKLIDHSDYQQDKVYPLFPHYPINFLQGYIKIFGFYINLKKSLVFLRESVRIWKRPVYEEYVVQDRTSNFVFFSGSIWEKEPYANLARANFIRFCIENQNIDFEGGFVSRSDGENQGFDELLNKRYYSPKRFNELSSLSILGFNNPAVLGAVSWRFAEYLNSGVAIVSLPFKIELPIFPQDGKEIIIIENTHEIGSRLDSIVQDKSLLGQIGLGGKEFFSNNCSLHSQLKYLLKIIG